MSAPPIYLDYQATAPVDPAALTAMRPYWDEKFGNPHSSGHSYGFEADRAVRQARAEVAGLLSADDSEIVFTSGATESCNLALRGAAAGVSDSSRNRVVTVATEHPAVLETARILGRSGFESVILPVTGNGLLNLCRLDDAVDERTLLVSVMTVNNEIGVIQPISRISAVCRRAGGLLHTDATQAAGQIPIDAGELGIDLLSRSAHKMYGPKGVGALFVRSGVGIEPMVTGGGQERRMRGGTLAAR